MLFEDETWLRELPPLRACRAKRGERAEVAITGNNARRRVFGALNPRTGGRLLLKRLRNRAEDFCAFLRHLRSRWKRWDIFLVLDQGAAHTARCSRTEAARLRMELAFRPTAGPELNPQELIWAQGKNQVSANRTYPTADEQADAFIAYLEHLSPAEARRISGSKSANLWLPA